MNTNETNTQNQTIDTPLVPKTNKVIILDEDPEIVKNYKMPEDEILQQPVEEIEMPEEKTAKSQVQTGNIIF